MRTPPVPKFAGPKTGGTKTCRIGDIVIIELLTDAASRESSALFLVASVVLAGLLGGWLAKKLHVPAITGNIVIGAAIGLTIFRELDVPGNLQPLSTFATSLIAVSVGQQLSYRRIRSALKRILGIALLDSSAAFACVAALTLAFGADWVTAILLASLAIETAPATSLAIIREMRAKGPFVKTLLGVVAIDAGLCITVFAFVQTLVANYYSGSGPAAGLQAAFITTAIQLAGSLCVGILAGLAVDKLVHMPHTHDFSILIIAILVCTEVALILSLSPLITCLIFGICLGNLSKESDRLVRELGPIEPILYTCFFTLAGMSVHLDALFSAGAFCLVYVAARCVGKMAGAFAGARVTHCSPRIATNIPFALIPQAGVVIGLLVLLESDPRIPSEIASQIVALLVAAVTINEIIGPLFTRRALNRSREAGLDRPRLMEFLQEEFILTNLEAEDKWDALHQLTDFFVKAHRLDKAQAAELYDTIVEREKQHSTAIGHGAAIPHGRLDITDQVQGVLGISRKGVPFDAPDGEPAKLIMVIATPTEHEKHHLEVMAGLAGMVSDPIVRERLIAAVDPNDAWEIIEEMGARTYNYFLEDVEEEVAQT
ncbi:MAG: PTS sugar transporter subunit IIA [Candidatus Hydrogenedentes bacterium]|nr:PTS sugar transporter subunit IIA [Candidatus Hydrogenedentota bacterium]